TAAERGLHVRVAIAGTQTAARLLVRHRAGITVIGPAGTGDGAGAEDGDGSDARALAPLPLALLADIAPDAPEGSTRPGDAHDLLGTLRRWGLKTLGDLAALPAGEVAARLG